MEVDNASAFIDELKDVIWHIILTIGIASNDGALAATRRFEESYGIGNRSPQSLSTGCRIASWRRQISRQITFCADNP